MTGTEKAGLALMSTGAPRQPRVMFFANYQPGPSSKSSSSATKTQEHKRAEVDLILDTIPADIRAMLEYQFRMDDDFSTFMIPCRQTDENERYPLILATKLDQASTTGDSWGPTAGMLELEELRCPEGLYMGSDDIFVWGFLTSYRPDPVPQYSFHISFGYRTAALHHQCRTVEELIVDWQEQDLERSLF